MIPMACDTFHKGMKIPYVITEKSMNHHINIENTLLNTLLELQNLGDLNENVQVF